MKHRKWLAGSLALTLCAGMMAAANMARAQEAPPGGGGAQTERQRERQAERERERERWMNMTPEERQQMMRERREQGLRNFMERAGATDTATQDAILEFVNAEEKARGAVRETGRKVFEAARTGAVADTQMSVLLGEFRNAVLDEKARRVAAARALDEKIGYTKKPRLEALLVMMGFIGDEALYMAGGMGMPMGMMMPGAAARGMAGGRGGRDRAGGARGEGRRRGNRDGRGAGGAGADDGGEAPAPTPGAPEANAQKR